ncbi:MAG: hypothetical protein ACM3KR_10095, partial [Deltaproteobacteria bacterium]
MKKSRISIALIIMVMVTVMVMPISSFAADTTKPTFTVTPESGNISSSSTIKVTAYDNVSINHIGYAWDSNATTPIPSNSTTATSFSADIPVISSSGPHTLYVYAKDNAGNAADWKTCYYTIGSNDTTRPSFSLNIESGNIACNSTIRATATDNVSVNHIGYAWDSNATTPIPSNSTTATSFSADIPVPGNSGPHTLYVYAKDNAGNAASWKTYYYTVGSSSNTYNDTTRPSFSLNIESGNIACNSTIRATATDNVSVNHIGYAWDSNATTPIPSNSTTATSFSADIPVP